MLGLYVENNGINGESRNLAPRVLLSEVATLLAKGQFGLLKARYAAATER